MAEFDEWTKRRDDFFEWLDLLVDPASDLSEIILQAGAALELVFGAEKAAQTLLPLTSIGQSAEDWRDAAELNDNYMEWEFGQDLLALQAYAKFGLTSLNGKEAAFDSEKLEATLERANALISNPCAEALPESSPLLEAVIAARGRHDLDNGYSVDTKALAILGEVKMSRIVNLISGANPELPRDEEGKVVNDSARAWLAKRPCFLPTLWGRGETTEASQKVVEPVFVPFAKDGTIFDTGCRRDNGYQIGPKGDERVIEKFDEALSELQKMQTARWRRPNENGNWGIVVAAGWRRISKQEL